MQKNIENDIKILLNLFNTSNFDLVISKSKKLIREFPEYLVLYNLLGSAYQNTGRLKLAKEIFIRGNKIEPNNIAIMNNLANTYKNLGDFELSENLFEKIIEKKPDYINAYINLGNLKRDLNDFKSAIKLYEKALKINNQLPVILYSLALAHQGLGDFKKTVLFAKKALLLDPKFTQADILISQSTKYKLNDVHYEEMKNKINNLELNLEQKINLNFAIAKANEDFNNIEKSYEHLAIGNKLKRGLIKFDINKETEFFNDIKKIFTNINYQKFSDEVSNDKKIIFILGMPRSGTSLVEQIITSHSDVFGAGELPYLSKIIQDEIMESDLLSLDKFNNLINDQSLRNKLRQHYLNHLKTFNSNKKYITDKAPLNFRWIGFIKILFPDAKIIHCYRNPKDNCLSLFKNLFEGGLNFSYDQKELGIYYKLYLNLMKFWNENFPNSIYSAEYEQIVENQEFEIKKIIKFCDLPWEENCLSFDKNKTPIKTMSAAQARQKIYKGSVNSFEKFAFFLKDLSNNI